MIHLKIITMTPVSPADEVDAEKEYTLIPYNVSE